jgi:hypothetical protein
MADLYFAVIALKDTEVDQVINNLTNQMPALGLWLDQNRLSYGPRNEDWKPFNGSTIAQLVKETKGYQSKTILIDKLDAELTNLKGVDSIQVYFIDAFALFLNKYAAFASEMGYFVGKERQCCLVISDALSNEEQKQLIRRYCLALRHVCQFYRDGRLHRIAEREDDLRNFCNYLIDKYGRDRASEAANQDERLQSETKHPPRL